MSTGEHFDHYRIQTKLSRFSKQFKTNPTTNLGRKYLNEFNNKSWDAANDYPCKLDEKNKCESHSRENQPNNKHLQLQQSTTQLGEWIRRSYLRQDLRGYLNPNLRGYLPVGDCEDEGEATHRSDEADYRAAKWEAGKNERLWRWFETSLEL